MHAAALRRLVAVALTALAAAAPAAAAFDPVLRFSRLAAPPGARIAVRSGVPLPADGVPYALFLVPRQALYRVHGLGDPRVHYLGRVRRDDRGIGHVSFRVPRVPPGIYVALLACEDPYCGIHGLNPVGPAPSGFHVTSR